MCIRYLEKRGEENPWFPDWNSGSLDTYLLFFSRSDGLFVLVGDGIFRVLVW